jgi:ribonuclease Z
MRVKPVEASSSTTTASPPRPVYKDENVTVYALTISSSPDSEMAAIATDGAATSDLSALDIPSKRKREATPDSPRKRSSNQTLKELMEDPEFLPEDLTNERAHEWREHVIKTMFPDTKINSPKKGGKGKE